MPCDDCPLVGPLAVARGLTVAELLVEFTPPEDGDD